MTYCTGGIRCVKVAAYLEQELGFTNVTRLDGGIVSYAQYARSAGVQSKFKGKNYVFDGRMAERVTEDVLSGCVQCGAPCDDHRNCANVRCHTRFIQVSNFTLLQLCYVTLITGLSSYQIKLDTLCCSRNDCYVCILNAQCVFAAAH
jgi:predicted sulfurtransferase